MALPREIASGMRKFISMVRDDEGGLRGWNFETENAAQWIASQLAALRSRQSPQATVSQHVGEPSKPGARSWWRGWPITWNGEAWRFDDDGEPVLGYGGKLRPCKKCGELFGDTNSDHCLGNLPGVNNACCGHGQREESYIRFTNGVTIRGFEIEWTPNMEGDDA